MTDTQERRNNGETARRELQSSFQRATDNIFNRLSALEIEATPAPAEPQEAGKPDIREVERICTTPMNELTIPDLFALAKLTVNHRGYVLEHNQECAIEEIERRIFKARQEGYGERVCSERIEAAKPAPVAPEPTNAPLYVWRPDISRTDLMDYQPATDSQVRAAAAVLDKAAKDEAERPDSFNSAS